LQKKVVEEKSEKQKAKVAFEQLPAQLGESNLYNIHAHQAF